MFDRRMSSSRFFRRRSRLRPARIGLLVSTWLACAAATATAATVSDAAVAAPFVATPAQLFGPLFVQVQMDALFPDGKAFADAVPKDAPLVILRRYRAAEPRSHVALLRFVKSTFSLPAQASTPPAHRDKSLEGHIARLWPLLTRQPAVPAA